MFRYTKAQCTKSHLLVCSHPCQDSRREVRVGESGGIIETG